MNRLVCDFSSCSCCCLYFKGRSLIPTHGNVQAFCRVVGRLVGKEVSILDKEYLLLPIVAEGHWSLAIFCHPGGSKDENGSKRCLLHLDSSPGIHVSESVFSILRRFLKAVWEHWKGADEQFAVEDIAECTVPVPPQPNTYDCGPFVLHSLETFVKQAPEVFTMAELQCHEDSEVSDLNRPSWIGCTPSHKRGLRGPWTYLYVLLQSTALEELVQSEATPRYEN